MVAILSPAKRMEAKKTSGSYTIAEFQDKAMELMSVLKKYNEKEIQELMDISPKIADLNMKRNFEFNIPHKPENARQAVLAYKGDVYVGLGATDFTEKDLEFAQKHLRILSGLYGLLRPMDLVQEYRLEMGIKLQHGKKKDLYEFWKEIVTDSLNQALRESGSEVLMNTASDEYLNAIDLKKLKARILKVQFREYRDDKLKFISFNAKKARGSIVRYMIKNHINDPNEIKGFDYDGYYFDEKMSGEDEFWFIR
jgi:cytoplasmic iron level regulating protein YaaA (DUF328/UPF0246 family)